MASAHGAGFMVLPFLMSSDSVAAAAAHDHAAHMAAARANDPATGALAVAVHTLAYLLVMTVTAWVVYRKLGLGLLRTAWFNVDWLWAAALVVAGTVVLFKQCQVRMRDQMWSQSGHTRISSRARPGVRTIVVA